MHDKPLKKSHGPISRLDFAKMRHVYRVWYPDGGKNAGSAPGITLRTIVTDTFKNAVDDELYDRIMTGYSGPSFDNVYISWKKTFGSERFATLHDLMYWKRRQYNRDVLHYGYDIGVLNEAQ